MKQITIGYLTESPAEQYASAIRAAKTKEELIAAIMPYKRVADDALAAARKMTDADFSDFIIDIMKAGRNQSAKWVDSFNARFGAIAIPAKLMIAHLVADQYKVPWGAAVIRCEEEEWPMLKVEETNTTK